MTSCLSLEEQEQEEAAASGVSHMEDEESPWEACPSHGGPLSSWCATCRVAVCAECRQFHEGRRKHQVVDYRQARELLLSRYEDESQAFLEWLVRVEAATRATLEATEAAVPPLRQTLSLLESHIGRVRGHGQALEGAASLEALEDLLEKRSRWSRWSRADAQQQVDDAAAALGRIESAAAELRRLQQEFEDGLALSGGPAPGASAATEEEPDEGRQEAPPSAAPSPPGAEAALPANPRVPFVVAHWEPRMLGPNQNSYFPLPSRWAGQGEEEGPRESRATTTTYLEFQARDGFLDRGGYYVRYFKSSDEIFWIYLHYWNGRVEMETRDPKTGTTLKAIPEAEGRRLQLNTVHRARIVESSEQYEVFLDGVRMGRVQKAGGPSTPPEAGKISLMGNCSSFNLYILKFLVKVD